MNLRRRTFLAGSAVAGAATMTAPRLASASGVAGPGVHERIVRDARMVWRSLPSRWQDAPLLGNGSVTALVHMAPHGNALTFALGKAGTPAEAMHHANLVLAGTPTSTEWELDLWNAELTGTVTTTRGSLKFSALVHHETGVLMVLTTPTDGEQSAAWSVGKDVASSQAQNGTSRLMAAALGTRPQLSHGDRDKMIATHRQWWNAFYTSSLVSIPDKSVQRFYWIQLYKAASTTSQRVDAHPLLNGSNHIDMAAGAVAPTYSIHGSAVAFPGSGSKNGGGDNAVLAWRLPATWTTYQHTQAEDLLRDVLHPALRKAVDFYARFLTEQNGRLHLPFTHSPDYADVADCTFDLSLLRWAGTALVESTRRLGIDEPRLAYWQDMLDRLVPYHTDADGVLIGAGVRLARSHSYASHLYWLHPLRESNVDIKMARRSFAHWANMPQAWHGRSHVAAASMAAVLRSSGDAESHLKQFLSGKDFAGTRLTPSTVYQQGDGSDAEVPLDAGQAVLDMLVDSANGVLEVFPAVPESWRDVSMAAIRTQGAFLVDASRSEGRTDWVRVRSEAGQPLKLRHGIDGDIDVHGRFAWTATSAGVLEMQLPAGETAIVARRGSPVDLDVDDVPANGTAAPWGIAASTESSLH